MPRIKIEGQSIDEIPSCLWSSTDHSEVLGSETDGPNSLEVVCDCPGSFIVYPQRTSPGGDLKAMVPCQPAQAYTTLQNSLSLAPLNQLTILGASEALQGGKEIDPLKEIGLPLCVFSHQEVEVVLKINFERSDVAKATQAEPL